MIYCMSDVHGAYERYLKMLEAINFSDEDTLYVLGDAIDRGPQSIDLIWDIMSRRNVVFLRGNHEQMCLNDLYRRMEDARALWQKNGGSKTRSDLLYKRTHTLKPKILNFFLRAPTFAEIDGNGNRFHLVHGFPSEDEHERLWGRPEPSAQEPLPGVTVIVGHTPTSFLTGEENAPLSTWHGNGIIDIDCGCAGRTGFSCLGCIRLDDMVEFYVE